eukprot:9712171-Prorocentrum_lima.AAC.1
MALEAPVVRLEQRQCLYHHFMAGSSTEGREGSLAMQETLDWFVSTGRPAHPCHSALKWGLS